MKKVISLVLVLVMVLACASLVACGGGGAPPPSGEPTPPPSEDGVTPPPSAEGGFTWDDMPTYPGASQIAKGSWMEPPQEGELHKVEWRHYQTGDSQDKVFAFYKSAMPGKGWQQMMEMEMEEVSWFFYTKNNEKDVAWVYVGEGDGKTMIHLMRGSE